MIDRGLANIDSMEFRNIFDEYYGCLLNNGDAFPGYRFTDLVEEGRTYLMNPAYTDMKSILETERGAILASGRGLADFALSIHHFKDVVYRVDMPQEERCELWGNLIDVIEDWLASKGITTEDIENPERVGEDAAIIYGDDYGYFADEFSAIIGVAWDCPKEVCLFAREYANQ